MQESLWWIWYLYADEPQDRRLAPERHVDGRKRAVRVCAAGPETGAP